MKGLRFITRLASKNPGSPILLNNYGVYLKIIFGFLVSFWGYSFTKEY